MTTAQASDVIKPRNAVVDVLLQLWMALSVISLFPLTYYAGTFLYWALTSGFMEHLGKDANALSAMPDPMAQSMAISFVLLMNYRVFKWLCTLQIHPRLGVCAMLRSDAKALEEKG